MIKKLSFGQYVHKDSLIHSLDCRLKIIYTVVLSVLVFVAKNVSEILLFTIGMFIIIMLTKIDFRNYIKNLRVFYLLFIFILLMYVIFSRNNLNQGLIAIWRFWMLITISFILTFSTTISSLIAGIEILSKPLKVFGFKKKLWANTLSV